MDRLAELKDFVTGTVVTKDGKKTINTYNGSNYLGRRKRSQVSRLFGVRIFNPTFVEERNGMLGTATINDQIVQVFQPKGLKEWVVQEQEQQNDNKQPTNNRNMGRKGHYLSKSFRLHQ